MFMFGGSVAFISCSNIYIYTRNVGQICIWNKNEQGSLWLTVLNQVTNITSSEQDLRKKLPLTALIIPDFDFNSMYNLTYFIKLIRMHVNIEYSVLVSQQKLTDFFCTFLNMININGLVTIFIRWFNLGWRHGMKVTLLSIVNKQTVST